MSYSYDEQMFRQIIMDHYKTPRFKGLVEQPGFVTVHLKNPSCGDDMQVQTQVENGVITEVHHDGSGCSICCASASMMAQLVSGETIEQAQAKKQAFYDMVSGQGIDEELLDEAISLQGVAKLPPRIKCATLGWKAFEQTISKETVEQAEGVTIVTE
ncbi:MAG: Fe-S cluster assembly sulfur transfer protein SufU [Culicoidibacterales bacterium]